MHRIRVLLILLVLAVTGCASASQTGTTQQNRQTTLLREEIVASGVGNMHDAITRLRPQFLRGRGQTSVTQGIDRVQVYMDNMHLGGEEALRTVGASGVLRVEFVTGTDTGFKFGTTYPAGVIHIITK